MINVNEIVREGIAMGMSESEAIKWARDEIDMRKRIAACNSVKFAKQDAENFVPFGERRRPNHA